MDGNRLIPTRLNDIPGSTAQVPVEFLAQQDLAVMVQTMLSGVTSPCFGGRHEGVDDPIGPVQQVALDDFVTVARVADGNVELLGVAESLLDAVRGLAVGTLGLDDGHRQPGNNFQDVVKRERRRVSVESANMAPSKPSNSLSKAQARRVVLGAQGFAGRDADGRGGQRPTHPPGTRDIQRLIDRLGQFQIDTINIVTRAHYMPAFSRLGPYDPALLDRATGRAPRRLFEYWGHAASLIDVRLQPALRHRMQTWSAWEMWGSMDRVRREYPGLVEHVYDEIARRGPIGARGIDHWDPAAGEKPRDHWGWNWSAIKSACEYLFITGAITAARRNGQFERLYQLPDRVLPARVSDAPTPPQDEAMRDLVRRAAQALGVATDFDLRDYFRTRPEVTRQAVADLVDSDELLPVRVEGWNRPAYRWHAAKTPRSIQARALISPFDSVMFERDRLEALFDFRYRIEIYVPGPQRRYGYYVYPFLLGDRFVARVDLKADRAAGVLRVKAAWIEPDADAAEVAPALAAELALMAEWLGLPAVAVAGRGDLAGVLRPQVRRRIEGSSPLGPMTYHEGWDESAQ